MYGVYCALSSRNAATVPRATWQGRRFASTVLFCAVTHDIDALGGGERI